MRGDGAGVVGGGGGAGSGLGGLVVAVADEAEVGLLEGAANVAEGVGSDAPAERSAA